MYTGYGKTVLKNNKSKKNAPDGRRMYDGKIESLRYLRELLPVAPRSMVQ